MSTLLHVRDLQLTSVLNPLKSTIRDITASNVTIPSNFTTPPPPNGQQQQHASGHMSEGELAVAVIIPVIFIIALMTIFIVSYRRRRRTNRQTPSTQANDANQGTLGRSMSQRLDRWFTVLSQAFNHPQSTSDAIRNANATSSNNTNRTNGATTNGTRQHGRRGGGRRDRPRRTDSGSTVKTLPEYDELREDEILLYKGLDTPLESADSLAMMEEAAVNHERQSNAGSRRSSRNTRRSGRRTASTQTGGGGDATSRNQSTSPNRDEGEPRRQTSLGGMAAEGLSALRRISLRRNNEQSRDREESNEMESMLPTDAGSHHPVSMIVEEPVAYDSLYPTIEVNVEESEDTNETSERRGGVRTLRSMFRRQPAALSPNHRRVASANSTNHELGLTLTRSNEQSLYRPSTSSSRRVFGGFLNNGSSASLLSQTGVESTDTLGRPSFQSIRHTRNISAPLSTRRLQFAPPVAGFSDKQMKFLTSVESLDKYGVPMEGAAAAATAVDNDGQRLPTFEELAREQEAGVRLPRLAPVLTSAEVQARSEQSPTLPSALPGQPSTSNSTSTSTSNNNEEPSTAIANAQESSNEDSSTQGDNIHEDRTNSSNASPSQHV